MKIFSRLLRRSEKPAAEAKPPAGQPSAKPAPAPKPAPAALKPAPPAAPAAPKTLPAAPPAPVALVPQAPRKIKPAKTGPEVVREAYGKREAWAHKGQYGRVLIVSGCAAFTGSPCFTGMAAGRAGADLVFIAAPERAANVAANFSPTLITLALDSSQLLPRHVSRIISFAAVSRAKAMLIGSGLWREPDTLKAVRQVIEKTRVPMVVDADAIRAVAESKKVLIGKTAVLTPHADEFKQLTGVSLSTDVKERARAAEQAAYDINAVILLKGRVDVITDGRQTFLNQTGCPTMSKGGCGDTLAGICTALLARGVKPLQAAAAAAFLNGRAGELAARELGEGILPTDLIEKIPHALRACGVR